MLKIVVVKNEECYRFIDYQVHIKAKGICSFCTA